MSTRNGVLFINTGSPASLRSGAVASYLRRFLSDGRILDTHALLRFFLVNFVIVPFRKRRTLRAYRRIWQGDSSPLVLNCLRFEQALRQKLPEEMTIAFAYRYANPSIQQALQQLLAKKLDKLLIFPLFPQYSSAANGSALAESFAYLAKQRVIPQVSVVNYFCDRGFFLQPLACSIARQLEQHKVEFLLFSYHGLPVRQLPCQPSVGCCERESYTDANANKWCYRRQCLQTTRFVAHELKLAKNFYATSFQSRLGCIPWIKPYSDQKVIELAQQGIKHLAVVCPSFVADCLETLEEAAIRLKDDFCKHGGKSLTLLTALNDEENWINNVSDFLQGRD